MGGGGGRSCCNVYSCCLLCGVRRRVCLVLLLLSMESDRHLVVVACGVVSVHVYLKEKQEEEEGCSRGAT